MMRNVRRQTLIAELLAMQPALRDRGVLHIALFGSRARQDNRQDSDIDLLVEIKEDQKFSLLDLVGVAHVIEDRVGLSANLFMKRSLDPAFLKEARHEQIAVF